MAISAYRLAAARIPITVPSLGCRREERPHPDEPANQRRNAPGAILVRQERYGRTRERIFPILTRIGRLGAVAQREFRYADRESQSLRRILKTARGTVE